MSRNSLSNYTKMTQELEKKIVELLKDGMSQVRIHQRTNVAIGVISKIGMKYGLGRKTGERVDFWRE